METDTPPLIITGMHRSGTSMTASMVASLGIGVGDGLVPADRNNPRGYFEDVDFVRLQGAMLQAATRADDGGHRDWGWTESETLDRASHAAFIEPARALLSARARPSGPLWGWKDPRSTVLLDFWASLVPGARYLLLYRSPWDVAESMQRLGAPVFLARPDYAWRIWAFYCRHLLEFAKRHRERVALVSTQALAREPWQLSHILQQRLGIPIEQSNPPGFPPDGLDRFRGRAPGDPLASLSTALWPHCAELLRELDALADLGSGGAWDVPVRRRTRRPEECSGEVPLSVVIPTFNQGTLLVDAVASVERCAPGAELLIVDDGSSEPESLRILARLREAGFAVLSQTNQGLSSARNRGFAEAHGTWVFPLDDDNRLLPGWIDAALAGADSRVAVIHGNWREFGQREGLRTPPPLDIDRMLVVNSIDAGALIRRAAWRAVGGYDHGLRCLEDWEFWIALLSAGWTFSYFEGEPGQAAFEYRVRPGSLLKRSLDPDYNLNLQKLVLRKHATLYVQRFTALVAEREALHARLAELEQRAHPGIWALLLAPLKWRAACLRRFFRRFNAAIRADWTRQPGSRRGARTWS